MDHPGVRIFLRPIGAPLTIGVSGLAIASFVESGLDLSWIAKNQAVQVGLILVSVPFIMQLIACVFSYLARDGATGATTGLLCTTWLAIGLIHITSGVSRTSEALGLLLFIAGGVLCLSSVAVATGKPLPALVFVLAAARWGADGVYEFTGSGSWQHAAGIIGLVVAGHAAYTVLAFELEGQQHKPVLPTFRVGRGRAAVLADDPAVRVDGVSSEAGVRKTS